MPEQEIEMQGAAVFSEKVCELGEGPSYDPATDTLYWFDIVRRKLLEKRLSSRETRVHDLPEMASAIAVIDQARQLLLTETGFYIRDRHSGKLTLHTRLEADDPSTRSNDARVHPCGALWGSTMGKRGEDKAGSIYWFFRGEVRRIFPLITIPNSICFSPDGTVAYFADTRPNILWRVECDPSTGLPKGEPKVFADHKGRDGGFDGSVVDQDGLLWNACWGGGSVNVYAPDGQFLRSHSVPATQASCPAFVGANAGGLAVTTAWQGMDAEQRKADPEAGKTFLLEVAVNGRHEPRVQI